MMHNGVQVQQQQQRKRLPRATSPSSRTTGIIFLPLVSLSLSLLLAVAVVTPIQADHAPTSSTPYPSEITLRAGVLHAPPFAMINDTVWPYSYSGFQMDLLDRLKIFAQRDNVTLTVHLSPSPPQYGDALDLVANDCLANNDGNNSNNNNITSTTRQEDECHQFDLIVGDYYCNDARSMRVDFTPSWLRTTMSTAKKINNNDDDNDPAASRRTITTLTQASQEKATVCVPDGTYLMHVVMDTFPAAHYLKCPTAAACLAALHRDDCVLYADDELQLRYRAALDPSLEVTREHFHTQYLVWPLRDDLPAATARWLKKWIYAAVANATLDDLYFAYFRQELCPVGTAGPMCELPCDPTHGTANAHGQCVCASTRWTGADCSVERPENVNAIPPLFKGLAYAMLGINVVVMVGCAGWLYWQRESAPVRVSQPYFLVFVLLGCLISSCTILAMAQEDNGGTGGSGDTNNNTSEAPVYACMAIPWLYSVGFSVTFGTLFAKIWRVYKMFTQSSHRRHHHRRHPQQWQQWQRSIFGSRQSHNNSHTSDKSSHQNSHRGASSSIQLRRTPVVTCQETLLVIGLVLAVDVTILVAWTVVDPLHYQRVVILADQFGAPLESQGFCTSDSWQIFGSIIGAFHLFLLGLACWLCYCAKDIPSKFSESKYLSIAMMSNLQILIVGGKQDGEAAIVCSLLSLLL